MLLIYLSIFLIWFDVIRVSGKKKVFKTLNGSFFSFSVVVKMGSLRCPFFLSL
ncbi:hypothetical protein EBME_0303 [bacterium endosymbiont of Mortierella elongata FMR23-6]|nr:hypothetical protein EBME_0303 [bacterium endosymbiont of Mortierella elongata FMR23-6]